MAQFVYLHIGSPKTGSTYLQAVLRRNRALLKRDGVFTPIEAFRASLDLRGVRFQDYEDPRVPGAWDRLVRRVRAFRGVALVSHENFASCEPTDVERLIQDLRFAEVHVILTARDLASQMSAVWQEGLKNRRQLTFAEWAAEQLDVPLAERGLTRGFWRSQHTADLLARWGKVLPADQIHLVTVPPPGGPPTLLWERFGSVIGLPTHDYDPVTDSLNQSLGAPGAAVLRRLNAALSTQDVSWPLYQAAVKAVICHTLTPRGSEQRIRLPDDRYQQAREVAQEIVTQLREAAYEVAGDLAELIPPAEQYPVGMLADSASAQQELDAAVAAMAEIALWIGRRRLADRVQAPETASAESLDLVGSQT